MTANETTVITGCNGLLGCNLIESAPPGQTLHGFDLAATSPFLSGDNYTPMDITDREALIRRLMELKPDRIINAAAYTSVDGAETEREACWRTNVIGVENLIYAAHKINARLVHLSTDYIFDGRDGPYSEDDVPNPLGFYGRSKLAAENALRGSDIDYVIVRTMILYGAARAVRPNFVTWLIDRLSRGQGVRIVDDQFGNTTLADELATALWKLSDFCGIIHIAGHGIIDRCAFALMVADLFDFDPALITPVKTSQLNQAAPRPLCSGLLIDLARSKGLEMSGAKEGLSKFKKQWDARSRSGGEAGQ